MESPVSRGGRDRSRLLRQAAAAMVVAGVLASCKLDLNPPPPPKPSPPLPSWRVVVWGLDDGTNDRVRRAIVAELLRRHIAGRIEAGVHGVDHVLSVSIDHEVLPPAGQSGPAYFVADETVTEGHDAAFAPQRSFSTATPDPSAPKAVAADPADALAYAIGDALARDPLPPPPAPAAPPPGAANGAASPGSPSHAKP